MKHPDSIFQIAVKAASSNIENTFVPMKSRSKVSASKFNSLFLPLLNKTTFTFKRDKYYNFTTL